MRLTSTVSLLIALTLICGCGRANPPKQQTASPPSIKSSALSAAGKNTLAYWNAVNEAFLVAAGRIQGQSDRVPAAFRSAASTIQSFPTLGVDPVVVRWALRAATVCEQGASLSDSSKATAVFVQALLRGANGDPLGPAIEYQNEQSQWQANYQMVRSEGIQVRAEATTCYGVEFPACQF